jgi:signal transduction histidine kinase
MPKMMRPPDVSGPYRTHFYDSRGQTIMPDDLRTPWDAEALARALHGETLHTTVLIAGEPVRILSTCGYNPMGTSGVIQKGYALKELYRLLATLDLALLLLIPVGLGAAGWLGTALTNQVLRRVHHMTQAAADFGAADFSRRLPVSGNDEFAALAQTFNNLLGGLDRVFQDQQQALQRQQRFIADASHELKTPLTVIRGRASLAQGRTSTDLKSRHAFHEIDTAAISMSRLVQDLLLLARSDEDRMAQDLGLLSVRALLESARDQAACEERAPMFIEVDGESLSVRGNETELVRLFRNLLDNAVRYTPPNGTIQVRARSLGDQVVVTVTDTGVGIAPEHLPHLGERFYRVDASRTRPTGGTGLGLSICREVVQAHHGTMSFQSAPGIGTTVTVTLPLPLLTD